ncbi:hypothetical protein ACF09H_28285 [Streptomyces sp. NPDC014983]|uniref:hypothetical protein n=1 Tax=Streptomyces sp. NPDC014983 TaxID=3364933 RepID=UPI0036F78363
MPTAVTASAPTAGCPRLAEAADAAEAAELDRIIERVRRDGRAHMNHMIADSSAAYGPRLAQAVPLGESIAAGLRS